MAVRKTTNLHNISCYITEKILVPYDYMVLLYAHLFICVQVIGVAQGGAKGAEAPFRWGLSPSTFKNRYTLIEQSVILAEQSFIKTIHFKQKFSQNC